MKRATTPAPTGLTDPQGVFLTALFAPAKGLLVAGCRKASEDSHK
jgi:hypothetical protein